MILDVRALSVRFSSALTVGPVSFTLKNSQGLALLGPNGSGKSTVLRAVAGLLPRHAGTVAVAGLREPDLYRRQLGLALDRTGLDPNLTGGQNLHLLALLRNLSEPTAEVQRVAQLTGISGSLNKPVSSYSLGMSRRLALGAAFIGSPQLLLLDEPTNGLDPAGLLLLRELLRQHVAAGGVLLLATHQLEEVAALCTHALVLRAGQVMAQGPLAELLPDGASIYEQYQHWQSSETHSPLQTL